MLVEQSSPDSQAARLLELLEEALVAHADRPAFTSLGRTLSYAELDRLSRSLAAWLRGLEGVRPGDRLAVQLPNLVQYPVVALAALRAGLVVVNLNPLCVPRELEHMLSDSGARVWVGYAPLVDEALVEVLDRCQIAHRLHTWPADLHAALSRWVIHGRVRLGLRNGSSLKGMTPLARALATAEAMTPSVTGRQSAAELAFLQYTGGTTGGTPRAAMLSQANMAANIRQTLLAFGDTLNPSGEHLVLPLPLYHIYANLLAWVMVASGGHCLLISNPRDLQALIAALRRNPWTAFAGLNTLFLALCEQQDFGLLDFSGLHLTISGGMPLAPQTAQLWRQITGCEISEGYGLTEASPVVTLNPPDAIELGTVGLPLPDTELRIVDSQDQELAAGQAGELLVKGPQVMAGYWQDPEKTAQTLQDGWLRTGDMAVRNERGYVSIVDRKKDMVVISGFNVYPRELEEVLNAHEGVRECAVLGIPAPQGGEMIRLCVVPESPTLEEAELRAFCRQQFSAYKQPAEIVFMDSLPRSPVGKLLRYRLRQPGPL